MSTRVSYESNGSFETLRRKVRMEEEDMNDMSINATPQQQTDTLSLEKEMRKMKETKHERQFGNYKRGGSGGNWKDRKPTQKKV